jgi:uncharacterized Zn finger protein (UPF0148 family)
MFDKVFRKLRQLERGVKVPIEMKLDDNGYLDRLCPSDECGAAFKVLFEDWRDIVRDEEVFCPICRHKAESSEWNTPEQDKYIQQAATTYVQKQLGQVFKADARRFNRSQNRESFIKMTMSYKPGRIPIAVPANAADIMTQEFCCKECNCHYASIGAAFFCPSCGHNSVLDTFANSVDTVQKTLAAIPEIRDVLAKANDENIAEDSIRHICENSMVKLVSSFQRYAEACFRKLANAASFTVRQNLFQNLTESDKIWRDATSTGYSDLLHKKEYKRLALYFQQRHVLAHLDGIIDQKYIDRSNDRRFNIGQRLVVTEHNVSDLAIIVNKLAGGLEALT